MSAKQLPFVMESEDPEMDQWCWAAVAVSVARFYASQETPPAESPWTQCSIVSKVFGRECCPAGSDPTTNQAKTLNEGLNVVGHFNSHADGPAGMPAIQDEINQERPIGVHIEWDDGSHDGHFVVISGYSHTEEGSFVTVDDPRFGRSELIPLEVLRTAYQGEGRWTQTVWTESL